MTNATRVLIDLGSVVGREQHEEALDDALRRGLTSVSLLRERLEPLLGPGRLSTRQIRELIASRDLSMAPESPLEARFLRLLKQRGLPIPISQFEIREGNLTFRIDFAYPDRKLAIECDGFQFHSGRVDWTRDLRRRNFLTSRGWHVLHVTSEDIENPEAILQAIMKSLAA